MIKRKRKEENERNQNKGELKKVAGNKKEGMKKG